MENINFHFRLLVQNSKTVKKQMEKLKGLAILPLQGSVSLLDSNNVKNNEGFYHTYVCPDIFWQNTWLFLVTWE